MAQTYCTGPCAFYISTGSGGAPEFLGHTEAGFQIRTDYRYKMVMNDLSGSEIPLKKQAMGAQAFISGQGPFTRWNEAVMARLEARQGGGVRGSEVFGTEGAFTDDEGIAVVLWLAFPYSLKAAMRNAANGVLESGRRYVYASLEPTLTTGGSSYMAKTVGWHCLRRFAPPPAVPGSFVLYDTNMTGLPAIN